MSIIGFLNDNDGFATLDRAAFVTGKIDDLGIVVVGTAVLERIKQCL